jgi:hypothetical protein
MVNNGQFPFYRFSENNFTLSDPLPQIPYLKWARVRLNSEHILAFIYLKPKIIGTIYLL